MEYRAGRQDPYPTAPRSRSHCTQGLAISTMLLEGNGAPLTHHFLIEDRALRGPSAVSAGDEIGSAQVQQLIVIDQKVRN